jgi:hypothetical protein
MAKVPVYVHGESSDIVLGMRKTTRSKRHSAPAKDLDDFRAFLGPLAADYSDGELRQLCFEMSAMAEILLDLFASGPNKPEPTIEF